MTDVTTIKVPRPLRERIASDAATKGVTAAVFLAELIDRYEREHRLAAVGRAYDAGTDPEYAELTAVWESPSGDGLGGE